MEPYLFSITKTGLFRRKRKRVGLLMLDQTSPFWENDTKKEYGTEIGTQLRIRFRRPTSTVE